MGPWSAIKRIHFITNLSASIAELQPTRRRNNLESLRMVQCYRFQNLHSHWYCGRNCRSTAPTFQRPVLNSRGVNGHSVTHFHSLCSSDQTHVKKEISFATIPNGKTDGTQSTIQHSVLLECSGFDLQYCEKINNIKMKTFLCVVRWDDAIFRSIMSKSTKIIR